MLWGPWSYSTSRGGGEQRGQRPGRERHPAAAVERRAGAALPGDLGLRGGRAEADRGGPAFTGTPQTTAGTPITATTALMRFYAGLSERMDICSEVREIEIAYTLSNALGAPSR